MKEYLIETKSIDYMNPHIQEKVQELKDQSCDDADYIKREVYAGQNHVFLQRFLEQMEFHQESAINFLQ